MMVSSVKKWRPYRPLPVNTSSNNSSVTQRKNRSTRLPCKFHTIFDEPSFIEEDSGRFPAFKGMLSFTGNSRLFDPFNETDFFMFDSIRPGTHRKYDVTHPSLSRPLRDSLLKEEPDSLSSNVRIIPIYVENRLKNSAKQSSVRSVSPIIVDDEKYSTRDLFNSKLQKSDSSVILIDEDDKHQSSNVTSKSEPLQKDSKLLSPHKTEEKCEPKHPVKNTPPGSPLEKSQELVNKNSSSTSIDSIETDELCVEDSGAIYVKKGNAEKHVNPAPSYPIYSVLKELLAKENRQVDYIRGDGNCFFRAISKIMYGNDAFHKAVRTLIVDIIATNKLKFAQFVDGEDVQVHVERMSEDHCWATTCEIYAAATLLQRDIYMFTPNHLNDKYSWLLFQPVFKRTLAESELSTHPCCYVTLCNTNGNHYDRIVPDHGGCNCFLPNPQLDGICASVDLTSL
ncbi:unnamed protein product [Lymnaea stagnalis]|uniref:OTU domain-containing protein n=1 Tax=Lymnaea stagnalis TaxID=6523 RepID=A0AAV2GYR6_LYMST